jgi:hypothetical protein
VPEPLRPIGFWSYTSSDDRNSSGRLSRWRVLLTNALQLEIGQRPVVYIFQDVSAIPQGGEWETEINRALGQSCFLIPIVTPGFLQSPWCCTEVMRFRAREIALGRSDLIFPLQYIDTVDIDPDNPEDCHDPGVLRLLRARQRTDFRDLRFRDPSREEVSERIAALAFAIRSALRRSVVVPTVAGAGVTQGLVDQVSSSKETDPPQDRTASETSSPAVSDPVPMRRFVARWAVVLFGCGALVAAGYLATTQGNRPTPPVAEVSGERASTPTSTGPELDATVATRPIKGTVTSLSSSGWPVIGGQSVRLFGIETIPPDQVSIFASWIKAEGDYLDCKPVDGTGFRCLTHESLDVSLAVLLNGAAHASPDAPPAYRAAEEKAREAHRGVWQ